MIIEKHIQVNTLFIKIESNEEVAFLRRLIFDRIRYLHSLHLEDDEVKKEIAFLNLLNLETSHIEMAKWKRKLKYMYVYRDFGINI